MVSSDESEIFNVYEIDIASGEKINELDFNSMTVLMLEDRIQMMTNYYTCWWWQKI